MPMSDYSLNPKFAIGTILIRKYMAQKYAGKFRDYLANWCKSLKGFTPATLRANFANAKFGLKNKL